jgi:hypothetical protein
MAMVTIHQWSDVDAGLRELRRVSRGPVVILTFDGTELDRLGLGAYAPELFVAEARRYPGFVEPDVIDSAVANLRADLESGAWEAEFGAYRLQPEFVGALRLITALG